MSPILTLCVSVREVGKVTLMPHGKRGDLSKNRLLAIAGISSGSLAGPQGFRHLLVDVPNFLQLLCVEGIEPDREVHRLQLAAPLCSTPPRQHRLRQGTGMTSADVARSLMGSNGIS